MSEKNLNNCEKCKRSYSKYFNKKGEEDVGATCCQISVCFHGIWVAQIPMVSGESVWFCKECEGKIKEPNGLCQFCNPKSVFYIRKN